MRHEQGVCQKLELLKNQDNNNFYLLIYHEGREGHEALISSCPSW